MIARDLVALIGGALNLAGREAVDQALARHGYRRVERVKPTEATSKIATLDILSIVRDEFPEHAPPDPHATLPAPPESHAVDLDENPVPTAEDMREAVEADEAVRAAVGAHPRAPKAKKKKGGAT